MKRLRLLILNRNGSVPNREMIIPALGLIPFVYVLCVSLFDLPQFLNTLTIFGLLFLGVSLLLHWRGEKSLVFFVALYIVVFFLPLSWQWRGLEFDDNLLMGIFPFNDGKDYMLDAYRLYLGAGSMIMYNGRPLFSGLLAFFMWLFGGNIQIALTMICGFAALSVFALAMEVREFAGPFPAGMMTVILFYFGRPYLGRVHTESLGLVFGALGLALLLRGARTTSLTSLLFGTISISFALNARAGAFFVLPALVIWVWMNRITFSEKAPFLMAGVATIGFAVNNILVRLLALEGKAIFSNFGHSLYGLAAGYKGWGYIYVAHPELNNTSNVLPYALELIRETPLLFLKGVLLNYLDYLSPDGMYYLFRFQDQQPWTDWILYILTLVGIYRLTRLCGTIWGSLIISLLIGIFLSMSVLPHMDDGMRVLMATNPVNALAVGLALLPLQNQAQETPRDIRAGWLQGYVLILGAVCLLVPLVVSKSTSANTSLPTLDCPSGTEQISILVIPGSYINIVKEGPVFGFLPEVRKVDIKTRLDDYYARGSVPYDVLTNFPGFKTLLLKQLRPGDTIIMGVNLWDLNQGGGPSEIVFLVTRTNRIGQFDGVSHFCAVLYKDERLYSNRFYHDLSVDDAE